MSKNVIRMIIIALGFSALAGPLSAAHGPLTGTDRDAWIDESVSALVRSGTFAPPSGPVSDLTNLELAQLTERTAKDLLAKDVPPLDDPSQTPAGGAAAASVPGADFAKLVEEFKKELSAMDLDLAKLEARIRESGKKSAEFSDLQKEVLKRTGTTLSGYARAAFDNYRGFGANAAYGPMDQTDVFYGDIVLRSVPVPSLLFDLDLRLTRTIGLYFADPIKPDIGLWWFSLSDVNGVADLTVGDFYRSYTPLTLWNGEAPVYTLTEPTSYRRVRKDIESLVYMDHGPEWHLRGFQAVSDQALSEGSVLSSAHLQAMGGELNPSSSFAFAGEYAGAEAAADFLSDRLEVKGSGLLLRDDVSTSTLPYLSNVPETYAREYRVGSLSLRGNLPLSDDMTFSTSGEWAAAHYQDDSRDPLSTILDWAGRAEAAFEFLGARLSAKYINVGPYFYSPGAQTNRFTPAVGTVGYLSGNQNLDDGLPGYLDRYPFNGVDRPVFAPYDRLVENALPYGDSTPDREGFVLGFSAGLGKGGWLRPQGSYDLSLRETQANYVLVPSGVSPVGPVNPRAFSGYEGALSADLAKALDSPVSTLAFSVDYKDQSTDLGTGAPPFKVDTLIASLDVGPFPGVPLFEGIILSAAYEQAKSSGNEYVLADAGNPATLGQYSSYYDASLLTAFVYRPLDIQRTSWAFGFRCPIQKGFEIHGDWFINQTTWSDVPGYDRRDQIWRLSNEVSF